MSTPGRTVGAEELKAILESHERWRRGEAGSARANLARANLAGANLAGAYLARANLADADLTDANLAGANLAGANLADAYLAGANLADAYLAGAYLAAGETGRELEAAHGPFKAGCMIYRASTGRVPHFYASTRMALEDLRACAAGAVTPESSSP